MGSRKKAVSIRMSAADIGEVRRLAERLQVRDSDVIRFAVKSALLRLAPLCDESARGHRLVPVLMESGSELLRHFDLDLSRLESIVNEGITARDLPVERDDLRMIALHGMHRPLAPPGHIEPTGRSATGVQDTIDQTLRQYIYEKYRLPGQGDAEAEHGVA